MQSLGISKAGKVRWVNRESDKIFFDNVFCPLLTVDTCTALCNKVCQWLGAGQWFSPGTPVSSTNKTDSHNITEILLKLALIFNSVSDKSYFYMTANFPRNA